MKQLNNSYLFITIFGSDTIFHGKISLRDKCFLSFHRNYVTLIGLKTG